jgi:hypothetical protein
MTTSARSVDGPSLPERLRFFLFGLFRDTGDKALSKKVEACFMESSVGDEAARRAIYDSIYVAKVLTMQS